MSATLKDKKNLTRLYDGKLTFKTIVIKLYKQPKEQKKTPKIIYKLYQGSCGCRNR